MHDNQQDGTEIVETRTKVTYFMQMKFVDKVVCEMKLEDRRIPGWPRVGDMIHLDGLYNTQISAVKYSDLEDQFTIDLIPIQFNTPFNARKFSTNIRKGWKAIKIRGIHPNSVMSVSSDTGVRPEKFEI